MNQVNEDGQIIRIENKNKGLGPLQKVQKKLIELDKKYPAPDKRKRPY